MNQAQPMSPGLLPPGKLLTGKWTNTKIEILRTLGVGANGQVYLVRTPRGEFAMKVAPGAGEVAFEWHILEMLSHSTKSFPQPIFIDDSEERPPLYFYLMEKVEGEPFHKPFQSYRSEQIATLCENILMGLRDLHRTHHAFCDVKPENILVGFGGTTSVRFVDVGGVTPFGRSVRQFTPFYDRAFWGLGSRTSDAAYDLSALALMLVCQGSPAPPSVQQWTDKERELWLKKAVGRFRITSYIPMLEQALRGDFHSADEWLQLLKKTPLVAPTLRTASAPPKTFQSGRAGTAVPKGKTASSRRNSSGSGGWGQRDWTERVMWVTLASAAVITVGAWASFFGWM